MAKLIRRFEVDTQGATLIGGERGTAGPGLLVTTGRQILSSFSIEAGDLKV